MENLITIEKHKDNGDDLKRNFYDRISKKEGEK